MIKEFIDYKTMSDGTFEIAVSKLGPNDKLPENDSSIITLEEAVLNAIKWAAENYEKSERLEDE